MGERVDQYEFFWSGPFSQWQRAKFDMDGVTFNTAEQAMMYNKALLFGDDEIAQKIMSTRDARKQKALGREVRGFDAEIWDENKVDIVRRVNFVKFRQNEGLRRKLFQTGNKLLVEASPFDAVWGIGLDECEARRRPIDEWPGENLLGHIITEVRESLKSEFPDEALPAATSET